MISLAPLPSEEFTFDPVRHLCLDSRGQWIISVTQILEAQGLATDFEALGEMIGREKIDRKAMIGTDVHGLTDAYDLEGDVDPTWMNGDNTGYYQSWIGFRERYKFIPLHVSHRRVAKVNGFRFTMELDKIGTMGQYPAIVDLKCSEMNPPSWGFQTAGYEVGYFETPRCGRLLRGVARLKKDGSPGQFVEHKNHGNDCQQFLSALCNATERIKHGLLKPPQ